MPLQVDDDSNLIANANGLDNLQLVKLANSFFSDDEVLVRHHPSGHLRFDEYFGAIDDSPDSAAFVQRCKRVFTMNSSVGFEAFLYGKPTFVFGDGPYTFLNGIGDAETMARALGFIAIGYLAPSALAYDPAYVRWRLARPSEREVYLCHLRHYLRRYYNCGYVAGESAHGLLQRALSKREASSPSAVQSPCAARLDAGAWRGLCAHLEEAGVCQSLRGSVAVWGTKPIVADLIEALRRHCGFETGMLRGVVLDNPNDTPPDGLPLLSRWRLESYGLRIVIVASPLRERQISEEIAARLPKARVLATKRWIGRNRRVISRRSFDEAGLRRCLEQFSQASPEQPPANYPNERID